VQLSDHAVINGMVPASASSLPWRR